MHGEDSLDADSEADSTHCERFTQHFAATAHHHALEWLDTLFIAFAFFQADVDSNGIARAEFGEILAELRVLHTANYRFHFYLSVQTRSGGASLRRTICNFTEFRGVCLHEMPAQTRISYPAVMLVASRSPRIARKAAEKSPNNKINPSICK